MRLLEGHNPVWLVSLYERTVDSETPGCAYAEGKTVWAHREKWPPASQGERLPGENPNCRHLAFRLPGSRTVRKFISARVSLPGCGRISCQPWKTHATGVEWPARYMLGQPLRKCSSWGGMGQAWRSSSCFTLPEVGDVGGRERCLPQIPLLPPLIQPSTLAHGKQDSFVTPGHWIQ